MSVYCSTSHLRPTVITGSVEQIRDLLCGPQDHNEHVKGHRWHLYTRDDARRMENVESALRKLHADRRAREEARS